MIDEQEIRRVINDILVKGLLSIRYQGAMGRAQYCKIEADHLHNLPQILFNLSAPLVDYYYRIERPIYLRLQGESNRNGILFSRRKYVYRRMEGNRGLS